MVSPSKISAHIEENVSVRFAWVSPEQRDRWLEDGWKVVRADGESQARGMFRSRYLMYRPRYHFTKVGRLLEMAKGEAPVT